MTKTKTDLASVVREIVEEQNELEKALPLIERKRGKKKQPTSPEQMALWWSEAEDQQ
jgi:hypothetical protein